MRMKRTILAAALLATSVVSALAQSSPNWARGYVPTAAEWNALWASKQDALGSPPLLTAGGTMLGVLVTATPSSARSGFNLPQGTAPSSPNNGDLWATSSGLFVRISGATVGPIASITSPAGSIVVGTTTVTSGSANAVLFNNGGTLGNVTTGNNGVLVTSAVGAPSISTTLSSAVQNNITELGTIGEKFITSFAGGVSAEMANFYNTTSITSSQTYIFIGQSGVSGRSTGLGFVDNTDGTSGYGFLGVAGDSPVAGNALLIKKGGYAAIGTASFYPGTVTYPENARLSMAGSIYQTNSGAMGGVYPSFQNPGESLETLTGAYLFSTVTSATQPVGHAIVAQIELASTAIGLTSGGAAVFGVINKSNNASWDGAAVLSVLNHPVGATNPKGAINWSILRGGEANGDNISGFLATNEVSYGANITFDIATDDVLWTAHGLVANKRVVFTVSSGGTLPTGVVVDTIYFVKTVTSANAFTLSATAGGALINLTGTFDCVAPEICTANTMQNPGVGVGVNNSTAYNAFIHGLYVGGAVTYGVRVGSGNTLAANIVPTYPFAFMNNSTTAHLFQVSDTGAITGTGSVSIRGSTSGTLIVAVPAAAGSNTITLPAGTTDFSATGGTSQVVKQISVGSAFTVARLACADLSDAGTGCSAASGVTALTGDVTATGPGSVAATLATVNSNVGTFGSATQSVQFTVNGKGLITAAANVTVTPAVGSITGLGTSVATALAVNVGSSGAFVVNGGALGTPSSGTLTNATGLPISTGVSGLGTNVATALGVAVGSAGSFVVNGGALGSPSSAGTLPAHTLGGTISGGGNQINNVIIGTTSPLAGAFTTLTASGTATFSGFTTINRGAAGFGPGTVEPNTTGSGPEGGFGILNTSAAGRLWYLVSLGTGTGVACGPGGFLVYDQTASLSRGCFPATGGFHIGGAAVVLTTGTLGLDKITTGAAAPGAGAARLEVVCSAVAGKAKLIIYAGTSTTPMDIADEIGSGVTGC